MNTYEFSEVTQDTNKTARPRPSEKVNSQTVGSFGN